MFGDFVILYGMVTPIILTPKGQPNFMAQLFLALAAEIEG
jgi:hypothetical protein